MDSNALTIATELVNDSALVTVIGDVDMSSSDELRHEIESALRQTPKVVVEVGQMSFIDSSGLNALVKASRYAQENGRELRLRHLRPVFLQLLQITRLDSVFLVDDDGEPAAPFPGASS